MYRIWASGALLVVAIGVAALGATRASGFEGSISPQIPGIGNASGLAGPGPQVEVFGGRSWLRPRGTAGVEVRCTTSTATGCSGTLELIAGRTPVALVPFELAERQSEGIHSRLSRVARRKASQPTGLKLLARACAADSLNRSACDSAAVTVRPSRRP